jgi:capsular exopolysaccharide synthesis family protein
MGRLEKAMRRAAGDQAAPNAIDLMPPVEELEVEHAADELPNEQTNVQADVTPAELPPAPVVVDAPRSEGATSVALGLPDAYPPSRPEEVQASESALRRQLNAALATKTVVDETMLPASREQYRRLAAALHQAQRTNGFKVVMVASAVAGEGKTLTASNLAMTLSESYRRDVLLVDADLRRPSLHKVFQVAGEPGLSDGLVMTDEPKLPIHRISERLAVLPAGRPTSDPIGALTSERMRRLIDEAREVFDWVVIDTPPVGLLTDAALLTSMADGVILVVKAESTSNEMVQRAVEAIGRERVIGAVLNRATEQPNRSSYDYYKYYSQSETSSLVPPPAIPRT